MLAMLTATAAAGATASPYGECQPKNGIHAHQPQYHIIAPQFPVIIHTLAVVVDANYT